MRLWRSLVMLLIAGRRLVRRVVVVRRTIGGRVISRPIVSVHSRMIIVRRSHRTAYGCSSRPPPLPRRKVSPIGAGEVLMGHLLRRRLHMLLPHRRLFLAIGSGVDPVRTIKAGPVHHGCIVNHRIVDIRVVNDSGVHMHHRGVIGEMSTFPASAVEARTAVAVAIVHPAVKADVGSPVSAVPRVKAATPTPIPRSPKKSRPGSKHPRSGNPEVAGLAVRPVSRSPEISIPGANRLCIHRKDGRSDRNGNKYARKRRSWHNRNQ